MLDSLTSTSYQQQLERKVEQTREEFAPFGVEQIDVFESPALHYRMRAEFKIWHQGNRVTYAMYRPGEHKQAYTVEVFAQGSSRIQTLMPLLLDSLNSNEQLRNKLFQAEFLTSSTGDAAVTLVYHKPLCDLWAEQAKLLAEQIQCNVIGRSRGKKMVIGRDHVFEEFTIGGRKFRYQQIEGSFTQPNAAICAAMLEWISARLANPHADLIELYCGNGNFTLPLAQNFRRVLATEVSKASIRSAQFNCHLNGINNISFVRMSSEELTQALTGARPFRRLQTLALDEFAFSSVFVDPPRAGLDDGTRDFVGGFDVVGYISCNPQTLQRDLLQLARTHTIEHMALFDQFPYTDHRECGVVLRRR